MGAKWQWAALTLALSSGFLVGCGGDDKGSGGAGGSGTSGGAGGTSGAGGSGGSTTAGKGGTGGQGGMAGNGGGTANDPGLECPDPESPFGAVAIPVNGQCLKDPGAESGGARILSRSFFKTSVLADASGQTIIYGETSIGPELDSSGAERQGPNRLVFLDRTSLKVTSEIATTKRPYPRAVGDAQVVWHEDLTEGPELRVATRAAGVIAESTRLTDANSLSGTGWERGWIQGEQLFYEEAAGFSLTLRRVPLAGGTVTSFSGLLQHVVKVAPPIAIGSVDSFDEQVHLLELHEGSAATAFGEPLVLSKFAPARFTTDASSAYALVAQSAGPDELYRMPLDGSAAPTKLGQYEVGFAITSDSRFFVTYDDRVVQLVPVSGGELIELADFGQADVESAVLTAEHLFLIVEGGGIGPSSYLVEVTLPK